MTEPQHLHGTNSLTGGASSGPVVRVGDTVRRRTGPWTPAVHRLLRHLEAVGFRAAPTVVGIDQQGREMLTYLDGASGPAGWPHVATSTGLTAMARLLRAYHDATTSFPEPERQPWGVSRAEDAPVEVICHGDFAAWNLVWRDRAPVGIVDFDYAYPGPRLDDVAYALWWTVPFRSDTDALRWHAFDHPPDRPARIEQFASAYGMDDTAGLVDAVIARAELTVIHVRSLADRGCHPQASWIHDGTLASIQERIRWVADHRALFE